MSEDVSETTLLEPVEAGEPSVGVVLSVNLHYYWMDGDYLVLM